MTEEKTEREKAKLYAQALANEYGLEWEVMAAFNRYIKAGDDPWEAAQCALYDWDI